MESGKEKKNRRTETEIGSFGCTTEFGWALHREMAAAAANFGSPSTPASQAVQKSRSCHCRRRLCCCCCCRCTYSHCKRTTTHSHSLSPFLSRSHACTHGVLNACMHCRRIGRKKSISKAKVAVGSKCWHGHGQLWQADSLQINSSSNFQVVHGFMLAKEHDGMNVAQTERIRRHRSSRARTENGGRAAASEVKEEEGTATSGGPSPHPLQIPLFRSSMRPTFDRMPR